MAGKRHTNPPQKPGLRSPDSAFSHAVNAQMSQKNGTKNHLQDRLLEPIQASAGQTQKPPQMESSTIFEGVLQLMGQIAPLPQPFQQRIADQLIAETLPSKTVLLAPGQTARKIYYIRNGLIRSYFIDRSGREHTTSFSTEGQLATAASSFLLQQPSQEYLQALQETQVLSLSFHQLQSYYADFPQGNLIGRIITERHYAMAETRSRLLRYKSPTERYLQLLESHPAIEQLTTSSLIASYLGINRETLSRTRSRILRNPEMRQRSAPKNFN